jgi:hypothetical protein
VSLAGAPTDARRLALLAAAMLAPALGAPGPSHAGPPCRAEIRLDKASAFVGEQVVYRAIVWKRDDVDSVRLEEVRFPWFRAEWLPALGRDDRSVEDGGTYRAFEERRALFAARAGRLEIPPALLLCTTPGAPGRPQNTLRVEVPGASLEALPLPAEGRPAGFAGLVGPVEVHSLVEPAALRVGESLRVVVTLRGGGNLWTQGRPLPQLPGVEVFERPAETALEPAASLGVRRSFSFDLVPHEAGDLAVPEIALDYFDPKLRRYAVARAPGATVRVSERAAPAEMGRGEPGRAGSAPDAAGAIARGLVIGAVVAAAAVGATLAWRRRGRPETGARVADALREADRAALEGRAADSAAALARALRLALAARIPGALGLSAEEVAARAQAPGAPAATAEAARLLLALDGARFAAGSAGSPHPREVRAALDALG